LLATTPIPGFEPCIVKSECLLVRRELSEAEGRPAEDCVIPDLDPKARSAVPSARFTCRIEVVVSVQE